MKRWRVVLSSSVLVALVLFVCLVPVPVSRIRGVGLVQPSPEALAQVYVRSAGRLEELKVKPGDHVRAGDVLAVFSNRDRDNELDEAQTEQESEERHLRLLEEQKTMTTLQADRVKIDLEAQEVATKRDKAATKVAALEKIKADQLTMRAPSDGVIGQAPRIDEIGKYFDAPSKEQGQAQPLFTIIQPNHLRVCLPVVTPEFHQLKENLERPTDAALATRALLAQRVTVNYKETPLADVLQDLRNRVRGLPVEVDPGTGLDPALRITYQAEGQPLASVLDRLLEKNGLGYVVVSEPGNDHDGWVRVRLGHERGDPEGIRPLLPLDVTLRVQGLDAHTWKGKIAQLPESDPKGIPLPLSSKAGGPVPVKASSGQSGPLIPQTQHYLVYIDIQDPSPDIAPGTMAQVKIHCRPETCLRWLWRKINDTFNLGLI